MRRLVAFIALVLFAGVGAALAMSVSPILLDLDEGGRTSGTVSVINPTAGPLPVEFKIINATLDPAGKLVEGKLAEDDFIVLPAQATIAAGGTQNFRVQYVRADPLKQSALYQYTLEQVPVERPAGTGAQLQIVYSISGVISVAPQEGVSDVSITATGIKTDDKGKAHPTITFTNKGNRHQYMSKGSLTVRLFDSAGAVKWRESLPASRIEKEIGLAFIPPNADRTFVLPYELPVGEGRVEAVYDSGKQK